MRSVQFELFYITAVVNVYVGVVDSNSIFGNVASVHDSTNTIQICGRRLTEFLHMYCNAYTGNTNRFYTPAVSTQRQIIEPQRSLNSYTRGGRYIRSEEPNSVQRKKSAYRGIADECCQRPCKVVEIRKYCGTGITVDNQRNDNGPAPVPSTSTTTTTPATTARPFSFEDVNNTSSSMEQPLKPFLLRLIYTLQQPWDNTVTIPSQQLPTPTYHMYNPRLGHTHNRFMSGRLSPRDTHRRPSGKGFNGRSRFSLASDETVRDTIDSEELVPPQQQTPSIHRTPTNWGSQARVVTDNWHAPSFPIPEGTNFEDVSEFPATT